MISVSRLIAAGLFLAIGDPTPSRWALWYLGSSALSAAISVAVTWWELGRPERVIGYPLKELREGMYFATSLSAQNIYNDIDKSMLARLSTLEATGIYSAAYRLIDVAFVPVRSLLAALYPRFFQQGARGARESLAVSRKLLPYAGAYAAVAGMVLYLLAPQLPRLLGADYRASVGAVRLLALLPLLKTIHYFAADALTGAGYQGRRTLVQVIIAGAEHRRQRPTHSPGVVARRRMVEPRIGRVARRRAVVDAAGGLPAGRPAPGGVSAGAGHGGGGRRVMSGGGVRAAVNGNANGSVTMAPRPLRATGMRPASQTVGRCAGWGICPAPLACRPVVTPRSAVRARTSSA